MVTHNKDLQGILKSVEVSINNLMTKTSHFIPVYKQESF